MTDGVIPVALFVYTRDQHLRRAIHSLRQDRVDLLYVFSDGMKGPEDEPLVARVRSIVRKIDWCEVRLVERSSNFGLGHNVISGVTHVANKHEAFIVWEDDLVCVPGAYAWMCAALRHYSTNARVMSVTGWTHPRVLPKGLRNGPYFDARAESWSWGAWSRSWRGMTEQTALEKMLAYERKGGDVTTCGIDLPEQARKEAQRNLWAARWVYHHLLNDGLCLRPPWSMVDHQGFDASASNAPSPGGWDHPVLRHAPEIPKTWPVAMENPHCRRRWRAAYRISWRTRLRRLVACANPFRPKDPGI